MNGKLSKFKIAFLLFLIIGTFFILRNRTPEVYITNSGHIFGTTLNTRAWRIYTRRSRPHYCK